ncbi:MAG: hypothetical protein NWE94_04375 [Candidatus Bathyarchaeota archaeon]|nr:hypothetical protein [Candidatus Bathyarchaeota archaeon]
MRKRNIVSLLLILPIAIFIWFVGWNLCWICDGKTAPARKIRNNGLTFTVLVPEQKYAT